MSNTWQPKFKEEMLSALLGGSAVVKAQLIDTGAYTYSASHQYLSSVPSGARIGAAVTLTGKSFTNGVFDATDSVFAGLSSAPTIEGIWIYVDTGDENTSPLAIWIDGQVQVTVAATASAGATTVSVDAIPAAISNGAVMTKVSGAGPATITLAGSASAGARSLAVSALASGISAGDVYVVAAGGTGLPIAAGSTGGTVTWPSDANKIGAI